MIDREVLSENIILSGDLDDTKELGMARSGRSVATAYEKVLCQGRGFRSIRNRHKASGV